MFLAVKERSNAGYKGKTESFNFFSLEIMFYNDLTLKSATVNAGAAVFSLEKIQSFNLPLMLAWKISTRNMVKEKINLIGYRI